MRIRPIPLLALTLLAAPLARAADKPPAKPAAPAAPPETIQIENFLDNCPLDDLVKKDDPNASLRTNLFTQWIHAHRAGKILQFTGTWQSTGSASKSTFSATVAGQSVLFDWFAACTLPVEQTDKALALTHNQRVSLSGTVTTVTYSIGSFGPELHIKLINASITDTTPPAPALGPISIRSAAAKVRLSDAGLLTSDKDKDDQMSASAAKADSDAADYIDKNHLAITSQNDLAFRHGQPYTGMPADLLMLMGKPVQIQSDTKSSGIETKTILFSTYGYADDAWLITLRADTVAQLKKVPIPDAKFYATAEDAPPAPPPPPPPPPPPAPKKPTLPTPPPENVPF